MHYMAIIKIPGGLGWAISEVTKKKLSYEGPSHYPTTSTTQPPQ